MTERAPLFTKQQPLRGAVTLIFATPLALLAPPTQAPFNNSNLFVPVSPVKLAPPDQQHTRIVAFTNPIPLGPYDWSARPQLLRRNPPQPQPYNNLLFTNPIPFGPYDWSAKPGQFKPRAPDQLYPDLVLLQAPPPPAPFAQYIWPTPFFPRGSKDATQPININLIPPFIPVDWSKPYTIRSSAPLAVIPYALLYSPPIIPLDLSKPSAFRPAVAQLAPNLVITSTPITANPFIPYDWSKPYAIRPAVPQGPLNLTLFLPPPVIVGVPGLAFSKDIPVALFRAYETAAFAARAADLANWKATANDSPSGQNWSGAGYMAQYEIDTTIELQGVFVNALTGVFADPTTITLYIIDPTGTITTQTWPGGGIIRDSLGHFHYILTPAKSGNWQYKWRGFGTAQATSPDTTFTVNASTMIPG